jgi:hypothetical protein
MQISVIWELSAYKRLQQTSWFSSMDGSWTSWCKCMCTCNFFPNCTGFSHQFRCPWPKLLCAHKFLLWWTAHEEVCFVRNSHTICLSFWNCSEGDCIRKMLKRSCWCSPLVCLALSSFFSCFSGSKWTVPSTRCLLDVLLLTNFVQFVTLYGVVRDL